MKRLTCLLLMLALLLSGCSLGSVEDLYSTAKIKLTPKKNDTWKEHFEAGSEYLEDEKYPQAIEAFSEAIEHNPKSVEAYISRGDAYTKAAEALLNNPSGTIMDIFNDSEKASNYIDNAREDYEKAWDLAPDWHEVITEKIDHLDAVDIGPIVYDQPTAPTEADMSDSSSTGPGETVIADNIIENSFFKVAIPDAWMEGTLWETYEHATVDGICDEISMIFSETTECEATYRGHLVTILATLSADSPYPNSDYMGILYYGSPADPECLIYNVYAVFPTEVQYTSETEAQYIALSADLMNVLYSLEAQDGCYYHSYYH